MSSYTIGQLARAGNVPVSTVRFSERHGILKPQGRSGGNYRQYDSGSLERLRFIRASQAMGFRLSDVRALIEIAYADETPCDELLSVGEKRLTDVRQRLKDLKRVERALARVIEACCRGEDDDICGKLSRLRGKTIACKAGCAKK